ncbi:hypothetical protein GCM10022222_36920 [Amycolatopsis ultiminotia]|uniref:DUF4365 domain-containing protein n=1 Tax=Amycolatopsis ultiminotia TaxID=543629 RepID=A0ABP6WDX9_9PSEU
MRGQVKCTGQFRIKGGATATWQVEEAWRRRWERSGLPVYFVLVFVDPDDPVSWLHHDATATLHRAAAFWVRVDTLPGTGCVAFDAEHRKSDTAA